MFLERCRKSNSVWLRALMQLYCLHFSRFKLTIGAQKVTKNRMIVQNLVNKSVNIAVFLMVILATTYVFKTSPFS